MPFCYAYVIIRINDMAILNTFISVSFETVPYNPSFNSDSRVLLVYIIECCNVDYTLPKIPYFP